MPLPDQRPAPEGPRGIGRMLAKSISGYEPILVEQRNRILAGHLEQPLKFQEAEAGAKVMHRTYHLPSGMRPVHYFERRSFASVVCVSLRAPLLMCLWKTDLQRLHSMKLATFAFISSALSSPASAISFR